MTNYTYNRGGYADLHVHTTASDGLLTPAQTVELAKNKGLKCMAVTDHDTTAGIEEAIKTGEKVNIDIIPGIELNAKYKDEEIHIIGYFIDYNSQWFQNLLTKIRNSRKVRGEKMISNLKRLYNIDIDYEEVKEEAGGASIARPHIARILVRKGYASDNAEAFLKYLNTDNPAYVERYRITPEEAVLTIKKVGGVPCIAHPALINNINYIEEIISLGIQSVEAYHSKQSPKQVESIKKIARKHNLVITGGSDFHGELHDNRFILGDVTVSSDVVNRLKKLSSPK